MSHPEDLLADHVGGTLPERERAAVEAHLHGCERCREEVRLAGAAFAALSELEDVPVPFGVTGPVVAEAGRRFERRRGAVWERFQWAAGLAAAAALILVVALNVGGGQGQDAAAPESSTGATGGTGVAGAADSAPLGPLPFTGLERQPGVNYDAAGIEAVAGEAARALTAAEDAAGTQTAFAGAAGETPQRATLAEDCVDRSGLRGPQDVLVRLIEAEFEGTPAYIAVFSEGPGAGQAPDHIVVLVVATDDCRLLTSASQRVPAG